jgi:polyisoprenoid-binding protein YceI
MAKLNPVRSNLFTLALALFALSLTSTAVAQEAVLELDPAQTQVGFTLGDVLHTVHGTFKLKRGTVRFDPATGHAGGLVVVDATSGDSSSHARDHKMNKDILESAQYPEITFTPQHLEGEQLTADTHFTIPYVSWGLKNPSTLFLRVNDTVDITIHAAGNIKLVAAH